MIPLIALDVGESGTVLKISGTGAEFSRLRSLGIEIDTEFSIVTSQAKSKGPVLLLVNGAKYALDYDLASKIFVRP